MTNVIVNGKVAIVTGANSGIGRVTARELALQGWHVFLACRSEEKTRPVLAEIQALSGGMAHAEFLPLDLGNLDSVRKCAELFLVRSLPLHLLVCNAGLSGQKGMTESGFELTFGVCHVGHFLLTQLLIEKLKHSSPARVVVVASKMHRWSDTLDTSWVRNPTASVGALKEYSQTKLANILFVKELGRRLAGTGVTTYAVHPGIVASEIWRSVPWPLGRVITRFMITVDEGARTSLHCATAPEVASDSGRYYDNCTVVKSSAATLDTILAARLWTLSEEWVVAT